MTRLAFGWAVAIAAIFLAAGAGADERIRSFDSEITIHPDGWLTVTETIRVRSEGKKIRRGIYRDFPVVYKDRNGLRVTAPPRGRHRWSGSRPPVRSRSAKA